MGFNVEYGEAVQDHKDFFFCSIYFFFFQFAIGFFLFIYFIVKLNSQSIFFFQVTLVSFQNFRLCKSRRHPFSTSVESVTKPTTAQLHCTDMRVYPFIQGAWPIVKLKLVSQPLSSKLAGLWRRLAPIGHEFLCLCSLEGRRGEGRGVLYR